MPGPVDIAFYAPMKAPDHPVPSGDRTMARMLCKALQRAGFTPVVHSTLRSFCPDGDRVRQESLRDEGLREADRIIAGLRSSHRMPHLWFSYHVYYKSPDWIGPKVAEVLGIPYVVAEGSRASKRAGGPWAIGHAGAEQALDSATVIFAMTTSDEEALQAHKPLRQRIVPLPPFIDLDDWPDREKKPDRRDRPAHLLTVAMMREGDKLESYRQLAEALRHVPQPWLLDIVGDGNARAQVEAFFERFGPAIRWHGELSDRNRMAELYAHADLLLWPAVNEAYGMVFLEAQAHGCPVVAAAHGGVASVVRNGVGGLLVAKDDPEAFGKAICRLLAEPDLRKTLAQGARNFVHGERNLDTTADRIRPILHSLTAAGRT